MTTESPLIYSLLFPKINCIETVKTRPGKSIEI
jgi:hypothetical protein